MNIRKVVRKAIVDAGPSVQLEINNAAMRIRQYMAGTAEYWDSKRQRVTQLSSKWEAQDLVYEILLVTIPCMDLTPIQSPAGKLGKVLGFDDVFDGVRTAAELLAVVAQGRLYELILPRASSENKMFIRSLVALSEEEMQYVNGTCYNLPSVIPPRQVSKNHHSGYINSNGSLILGKGNHHNSALALDVINQASSIALSLDLDVIAEPEPMPSDSNSPVTERNHTQFVYECEQIHDELLERGNKFYLTWKFDKRGRMYSQGYHVNIQATEYRKAAISLANKEIIG